MSARAAIAVVTVVIFILGCLLMRAVATNEEPAVVTGATDYVDQQNVTEELADCPPRTHHSGLHYVIATFNFSHVQTPFIVAAWILFVTLAKIGIMRHISMSTC